MKRKTKKRPRSKPKVKTLSTYKDLAWKLTSQYVRRSAADWREMVHCVTCGVYIHWKESQAGHFIPGRRGYTLYDLRGIHPQCYRCNINLKGNPRKYDRYMRITYGQELIDELDAQDNLEKRWTIPDLQTLITDLTDKLSHLN